MTEEDARAWVGEQYGPDAERRVAEFVALVCAENQRQNLIAPSTVEQIWNRHVVDSAQLVSLAPSTGLWLDIGTGGGFPGMIVALLRPQPTVLVEPRKRRVAFLGECAHLLQAANVSVFASKVSAVDTKAAVISARAVDSVENLLRGAGHCATMATRWLLPRGRVMQSDLEDWKRGWHGVFHVKQSLSDPISSILVAEQVRVR